MNLSKKIFSLIIIVLTAFVIVGCSDISTTTTTTTEISTNTTNSTTQTTETTSTAETSMFSTLQTTESPTTLISTTESVITYTALELISNSKKFYSLNEEFDKTSLDLVAHLSDGSTESVNPEEISVRSFSSTTAGEKTIYVIFNRFMIEFNIYVLEPYAFEINMEYYEEAINLNGQALRVALNNILHDGFINWD